MNTMRYSDILLSHHTNTALGDHGFFLLLKTTTLRFDIQTNKQTHTRGMEKKTIGDRYETQRKILGLKSTPYTLFGSDWIDFGGESSPLSNIEIALAKKILKELSDEEVKMVDMYVLMSVIRGYRNCKNPFVAMVKAVKAISAWNLGKGGFLEEDKHLLPSNGIEDVLQNRTYAKGLADFTKIMGHEKCYGTDSEKHPIFASRIADVDAKKLAEVQDDEKQLQIVYRLRIMMNQMSRVIKRRISAKNRQYVQKQINIIDLKGFGWSHYKVKKALQATTRVGECYYPDSVHRVYLVNTPFIFRAFFAIVKQFLHPVTQSKIVCLSGAKSAAKKMKELDGIELSDLPKWMGGACEGSCLIEMSLKEISAYEKSVASSGSAEGSSKDYDDGKIDRRVD